MRVFIGVISLFVAMSSSNPVEILHSGLLAIALFIWKVGAPNV